MADTAARILIVEDEPAIAEVLATFLGDEGYETALAVDGAAALAAARDDPPALVLLDVMVPGLDGPQVCRRLKADARTAHVPVVLLTALPSQVLAARLGDCPHKGLLGKPFEFDELLAAVRRHLPR